MPTFKVSLLSVCLPDSAKLTKQCKHAAHVHVYRTSLREAWLGGHGGGRGRRLPRPRGAAVASSRRPSLGLRTRRAAVAADCVLRSVRALFPRRTYRDRSHWQTLTRPVNFQPEGKLLPHFLIGSWEGPATSWPSHWPRRKRRRGCVIPTSHSSHWSRGVAHLVSTLSLVYHRPGGVASADEDNKGSRVASRRQAAVFQFSSFGLAEGVGRPPVPFQMKCEHCTRKVGAASGGTGAKAKTVRIVPRVGLGRVHLPFYPVSLW